MISRFPRVREYLDFIVKAIDVQGFARQTFLNRARDAQAKMNQAELISLGEELKTKDDIFLRMALGVGLRTPTRNVIADAIAKKGVKI